MSKILKLGCLILYGFISLETIELISYLLNYPSDITTLIGMLCILLLPIELLLTIKLLNKIK
jgi:hypothetical protein